MASSKIVASTVTQLKECLAKELPKIENNTALNTPLSTSFYERCLDTLQRLDELHIDLSVLSSTLIGTVVSKYKTCPDESVAAAAKKLVKKWKRLAKEEGTTMNSKLKQAPQRKPITTSAPAAVKKAQTSSTTPAVTTSNKFDSLPPFRKNICNKLFLILLTGNSEPDPVADRTLDVESAIERKFGNGTSGYKEKVRSLLFNIRKNTGLRDNIVLGAIQPNKLVCMSSEQLVSSDKAAARKKIEDDLADSRQLDWETSNEDKINEVCGIKGDLLNASLFTCGRCKSIKTTSTQKQTRSADEPMTVFVLCLNCNNRWKC